MYRKDIVHLCDGAVVAFQEYGDPSGTPVIFCHGWPSSRTMAQLADEPARSLGVRIISPDRPGISGSSMQLDRKLSDWPSLVERLADDLELGEFRILAISGGAPYAYATAVAIPERVRAIAHRSGIATAVAVYAYGAPPEIARIRRLAGARDHQQAVQQATASRSTFDRVGMLEPLMPGRSGEIMRIPRERSLRAPSCANGSVSSASHGKTWPTSQMGHRSLFETQRQQPHKGEQFPIHLWAASLPSYMQGLNL